MPVPVHIHVTAHKPSGLVGLKVPLHLESFNVSSLCLCNLSREWEIIGTARSGPVQPVYSLTNKKTFWYINAYVYQEFISASSALRALTEMVTRGCWLPLPRFQSLLHFGVGPQGLGAASLHGQVGSKRSTLLNILELWTCPSYGGSILPRLCLPLKSSHHAMQVEGFWLVSQYLVLWTPQ